MPYTGIDHFIARMRFRAAYPHIRPGSSVCDLGCGLEAAFLDYASDRIATGVGVDDQVANGVLAVLEHLTEPENVLREAHRVLAPGGSLIMTWPSAMVDPILNVLHKLHLISDEMESDEHQKRIPVEALKQMLQRIGFQKFIHRRFELGLNNLMVALR
jgi:hypothetical protein